MSASCNYPTTETALQDSLGLFEALGHFDMVVVPQNPSADMLRAGAIVGNLPPDTVRAVWEAMTKAAP